MKHIPKVALCTLAATAIVVAQLPAVPTGLKTITTPQGVNIRYKEPGICETTSGVKSYSGFIDVDEDNHLFFWFFESRRDPGGDPVTLWLNGGPGADMTTGLFEELGPCFLNEDLSTRLNPDSWNEISNMLFLSQPSGVGFSYGSKTTDPTEQLMMGGMTEVLEGRFATADWARINSTESAAVTAWAAIQAFYAGLPQLSPAVTSRTFHLATESYGGHWGPAFMNHFHSQNSLIANGSSPGVELSLSSLIIINGLIDTRTQAPSYPRFARNNTHGVEVNATVAAFMDFSLTMDANGCLAMIDVCELYYSADNGTTGSSRLSCSEASTVCRRGAELPYLVYSGVEDVYDVRNKTAFPNPPPVTAAYLNQAHVQRALGVDTNYTTKVNGEVLASFWSTGDWVNPKNMRQFERVLDDLPVRVALVYGDSDYICTWYGGEDVSLAANHAGAAAFRRAGYTPLLVDGTHHGDVRERGNLSFTRVFDAGHMVPWWQPGASLAMFNRTINGWDVATGTRRVGPDYATVGEPQSWYSQKVERERSQAQRRMVESAKFRGV